MRTAIALFSLACLAGLPCAALDPHRKPWQYGITQWQDHDGLPRNTVQAVTQTADGYIWAGTEGGLARFNGREFRVFSRTTDPVIPNNGIIALEASADGGLWVGTRSGLCRYKGGRFERVETELWPAAAGVRHLREDSAGSLWTATGAGVARFKDGQWSLRYSERTGLRSNGTRSLAIQGTTVWIGSTVGLDAFQGDQRIVLPPGLPADTIRAILPDRSGKVWVGSENRGLFLLEAGRVRRFTAKDGFPAISVRVLMEDRDGNVWIGTLGNGLCRYSQGRFDWLSTKEGLASDHVRALFEDREGNLWVGTEAGGLTRIRNGRVSTLTRLDGLGSDFIRAIARGRHGRLFVGTEGAGLYEYRAGRFHEVRELGMPKAFVTALLEDRSGNLWVGTEGEGAFRLGPSGKRNYSTATGIPENSAWALQEDKEANVWIGTSNGLLRVNSSGARLFQSGQGLRTNSIRGLHAARDGTLWISFRSWGLQRLKRGVFEEVALPSEASNATITSFYEDPSGDLWMTTNSGLMLWTKGMIRQVAPTQSLAGDYLCSVVEDGRGRLLISGSRGIFVAGKRDLLRAAHGQLGFVPGTMLTTADGMRSNECSGDAQPCGVRADNGELWFSTIRGVVRIPPGGPKANTLPPPVVIERVDVNGQPAASTSRVVSPAGNRLFRVEFAALTYRAPEKVRYRYMLEGVDREWVVASETGEALYHNLPPGKRRFLVMAANEDGVWSERVSEVEIDVAPYFFQRSWFYGLCVLAAGLIAFGAHWIKTRTLRREFAAVLNERARIAREIHDTLLQGFAGAALQLNALLRRIKSEPERAGADLEKVLDQIDGCLADARREIVELRQAGDEPEPFETRLRRTLSAAGPNLDVLCTVEGAPVSLGSEVEKNLIRIAQEAVVNASRHSRANEVKVSVRFERDAVVLAAADDGVGMNGAAANQGHFGIAGMRERAKLMGGKFDLRSAPDRGTTIEVVIPFRGRK